MGTSKSLSSSSSGEKTNSSSERFSVVNSFGNTSCVSSTFSDPTSLQTYSPFWSERNIPLLLPSETSYSVPISLKKTSDFIYDPVTRDIESYFQNLDVCLGSQWENHITPGNCFRAGDLDNIMNSISYPVPSCTWISTRLKPLYAFLKEKGDLLDSYEAQMAILYEFSNKTSELKLLERTWKQHQRFIFMLPYLHDGHFYLFVIDKVSATVEVYDSLVDFGKANILEVADAVAWFGNLFMNTVPKVVCF